jgi:hypothetical protein
MKTCSRENFGVSSISDGKVCIATPTRHFPGHGKFAKCDLYGKTFKNSDEAHKAMAERGYSEPYFSRSSVPIPLFEKHASHRLQCEFDALYRLYKWKGRCGINRLALRDTLTKMTKRVGIFHPATKAFKEVLC